MNVSDEELTEFQRVWQKEYGQEITKEEARDYSANLLNFFILLMEIDNDSTKEGTGSE